MSRLLEKIQERAAPPAPQVKHRYTFDAAMMLIYTTVVYIWGLGVHPLGRDYAAMACPEDLPFLVGRLFAWELAAFGTNVVPYRLVNLAVLYACMLLLYHLTRFTLRGPAWYGTLAAVLFMANPVHSEALLNLSGVADLLPCLAALAALTAYAAPQMRSGPVRRQALLLAAALALCVFASLAYRHNAGLVLVIVLYEWLGAPKPSRAAWRTVPFVALGLVTCAMHADMPWLRALDPAALFAPLYLVFYPIGLLPETAATFHDAPWLGWLGAAAVVVVVALIHHKARFPAILFGVLAMLPTRLFQDEAPVDLVHRVGGGSLLLANALFSIAAVALFYRVAHHPKWHRPVVVATTLLCLLFFALEIRSQRAWDHAGEQVRAFQQRAAAQASDPIGVAPDFRYYCGAPMCFSDAIAHATPFGPRLDATSVLPMHYVRDEGFGVTLEDWQPAGATFRVEGARPIDVATAPYMLCKEGEVQETSETLLRI
ncbi:MAG TPA: hypothetical protein ENN80_12715, partial [Candidatus Hydrogenedentes bacterium]|nr:hypothetical protein [Candidatus Hydrogenedentota bacterium]